MLVRHLICGVVIGLLAAIAGLLAGFSVWAVLGFYVLGANLGLGASALGALSHRPHRARRSRPGDVLTGSRSH